MYKKVFNNKIFLLISVILPFFFFAWYKSKLDIDGKQFLNNEEFKGKVVGKYRDTTNKNECFIEVLNIESNKVEPHFIVMSDIYNSINIADYIIKNKSTHVYTLIKNKNRDTITFSQ